MASGVWGTGYREIERLTPDDYVLSRDEFNHLGEVTWKPIEATADFVAPILHVHVKGELIRRTIEHDRSSMKALAERRANTRMVTIWQR